ncbi:MAG: carbon monoxide dehydrogenase subunit G [Gammaproteobacteria bacterium]|nr:carbon monoxide dehydrogenase subunit G [Gammaproteobacteria bacterium]
MEQIGEYRIAASREEVWQALNDPEILGACIPGCQDITLIDSEHFDVKVKAKVGPVSATFQAALSLQDLKPPQSYVIAGNVKGGAAGFGKGSAMVTLEEDGAETLLRYSVKANIGGKLAQVGSRLIDAAMRKMADEFFSAFTQQLTDTQVDKKSNSDYETDGQSMIWVIAFAVLAIAMILAF